MNERKTKGLTNLNSDEKIIRDTCVSLARMYFSQFAAISCFKSFIKSTLVEIKKTYIYKCAVVIIIYHDDMLLVQ